MYYVVINHYHNTILCISPILIFDYLSRMHLLQAIFITRIEYGRGASQTRPLTTETTGLIDWLMLQGIMIYTKSKQTFVIIPA